MFCDKMITFFVRKKIEIISIATDFIQGQGPHADTYKICTFFMNFRWIYFSQCMTKFMILLKNLWRNVKKTKKKKPKN